MQYTLFKNEGSANIVVVSDDGQMYSATNAHPSWDKIVAGAIKEDPSITKLFDIGAVAAEFFERLSDRVTIAGGAVYFDNEEMSGALEEQIVRFVENGQDSDWQALVKFYEKLMTNLEPHTREQLFRWLQQQQITITEDGDFVAFKGVRTVAGKGTEVSYESISRGKAIVDGQVYEGAIPNWIGAIVEMPRGEVQHDPSVGCHTGLHAGTWDYASNFARGATLRVSINPRDVVSVPTDCNDAKLRVCRYTVLEVTEKQNLEPVYYKENANRDYEDDYDSDGWGDGEEEEEYSFYGRF